VNNTQSLGSKRSCSRISDFLDALITLSDVRCSRMGHTMEEQHVMSKTAVNLQWKWLQLMKPMKIRFFSKMKWDYRSEMRQWSWFLKCDMTLIRAHSVIFERYRSIAKLGLYLRIHSYPHSLCTLFDELGFVCARHQARRAWSDGEHSPLNMDVQCIHRLENAASHRVCDAVSFDLGFVQE
jgi:hypothetical protein